MIHVVTAFRTLEDKTRSATSGDTITPAHRDSFLSWIRKIEIGSTRRARNFIESFRIEK